MKKKYLIIEFFIVFALLIIPPLFSGPENTSFSPALKPDTIAQFLISLMFYFQFRKLYPAANKIKSIISSMWWWALALGYMLICFAVIIIIQKYFFPETFRQTITAEKSIAYALKAILLLASGAFYEEILYRQFFPDTLITILPDRRIIRIAAETVCILIFAFSHRYLGWFSVINAASCGIILRVCRKKTGTVLCGTISHFIYNCLMLCFELCA